MKRCIIFLCLLAVLLLCSCGTAAKASYPVAPLASPEAYEAPTYSAEEIFANFIDSVVHIEGANGGGTGFFIGENIIATNNHVIADNQWLTVKTSDGSVYDVREILAFSENPDLALLGVDFSREPLSYSTHTVREGADIYALGAPMGIYPCISDGIVMKSSHVDNGVDYILSNIHSIGGNSGGPVLNAYGELIGVVVGGMADGPNSIDLVINAEQLSQLVPAEPLPLMTKAEYVAQMNRPDEENYQQADIKDAQPGQLVNLGTYEQDGNTENGAEDILWLVLEREGSELLAISLYCLDVLPYHNELQPVTWENSQIRKFLNSEFISTAFSPEEEAKLLESTVINNRNPVFDTDCGGTTIDRVYLLSLEEVMKYYDIPEAVETFYDRLYAQATAYTVSKGVWLEMPDSTRCWWWLRSNGGTEINACEVGSAGYLSFNGTEVTETARAIRPVIRISAS